MASLITKKLSKQPIGTHVELTFGDGASHHEKVSGIITDSDFTANVEITTQSGEEIVLDYSIVRGIQVVMMGIDRLSDQEIVSAAWKAAIVLLFPILEQHRMDFVAKHQVVLEKYLPISNSNGDQVNDPYDLEVGSLHYIVTSITNEFQPGEIEDLRLCRRIRNLLAHNRIVPYEDVRKLMCERKEM